MLNDIPIDVVVTYVDNTDSCWQDQILQFNTEINEKRYRNWDFLKFWFRSIEKNMKWINAIHFVVSNMSQVPSWINQNNVHIVLHEDIIPKKLLPTFNSTTIEMFIYRIPALTEHFIYSNDDMFAMNALRKNDFFTPNGLPIYDIIHKDVCDNIFKMQCKNSYVLAAKLAKLSCSTKKYFFIKHSMDPMLKSIYEEVHNKAENEIQEKCTKFREPWNFTQYLFPDYAILSNKGVLCEDTWSFRYLSLNNIDIACKTIYECQEKILCINDSSNITNYDIAKKQICQALSEKFANKSIYER